LFSGICGTSLLSKSQQVKNWKTVSSCEYCILYSINASISNLWCQRNSTLCF
jgi:hypothetical protein